MVGNSVNFIVLLIYHQPLCFHMILKAAYGVKILTARTYIDFNSTTDCQTLVFRANFP
jgi:hypothetical protein